jgi:MFS family permease
MALANLLFFIVVPVFVIGPFAGVYVDRWDRKKVMIISDVLRGIMILIVPLFVLLDWTIPIYIVVFLMFSTTRFFIPSKMALIPAIVSKEKLMVANSLSNTTRMIATVMGFAIAGFIVNWIGHMWGFYLDSLSYFISAGLIGLITPRKERGTVREDLQLTGEIIERSIRKNIWKEIAEGFEHMVKRTRMRIVTSLLFLIMAGAGSVFCIIIVLVQQAFGSVTKALGIFGVFLGLGLFMGTVFYGKTGQRYSRVKAMFISFILSGVAIGGFALYTGGAPDFLISGVLLFLLGAVAAPILTSTQTLIHEMVPDDIRGRIFSSMEALMHLAFLVFMFLTSYLSKFFSNVNILLACAGVFGVLGLAGLIIFRKEP